AGNTGSASATFAVIVDTHAPDAPVIASADGLTNDNTPTVSGIAEPNSTVTLYEDSTVLGTATAGASTGAWSIESATLADGSHSLSVSATDAAGNTSSASTAAFTIDTHAPASPVITSASPDTGSSSADQTTSATILTLSGTAEANSTV